MNTHEMARKLAKNDWSVLPVHPGKKKPLGKLAPNGVKDATTNPEIVDDWWNVVPSANIGVATGDLLVVDIDVKNGVDGMTAWEIVRDGRDVPDTLTVETPTGGQHIYFRCPEGLSVKNSVGRLAEGIDVRGEGGYVLFPPSVTEAGQYRRLKQAEVAFAPQWFLRRLEESANKPAGRSGPVEEVIPNGRRNDTLASLAGTMRRRGMGQKAIAAALLEENKERCDPPLPRKEVKNIATSIARYAPNDDGADREDDSPRTWEEPIPLHLADTPDSLPLDVFPNWMAGHIRSVAEFVQVPTDLPALLSLAVASGALQKKAVVEARPGWTEPLSLWGACVLVSGMRKSPTFKHVAAPVETYERAIREKIREEHLQALDQKEVLEKRLQQAKKEAVKASGPDRHMAENDVIAAREELESHVVPPIPQLWVDDVTSESLLQALAENNGRMLAMSPEGDLFKFMAGRYDAGANVLNIYKKAWTGEEAARDNRVTRDGSDVPNPALAVGICVQPQVLEDLAEKRTFRGEGLLARFLYVVPPSTVGCRKTGRKVPPLDGAAKARYEKRIKTLLDMEPKKKDGNDYEPHTLRLTNTARPVLWEFEAEVEDMLREGNRLDGLQDWGAKLVGQALRIAGILHIAQAENFKGGIRAEIMEAGVALARAFIPHAKAAHVLLGTDKRIRLTRYVWRRICDKLSINSDSQKPQNPLNSHSGDIGNNGNVRSLTKRDLWQAVKGKSEISSVEDLDAPLRQLETHHLIQVVQPPSSGPGRPPSPIIRVNPQVSCRSA